MDIATPLWCGVRAHRTQISEFTSVNKTRTSRPQALCFIEQLLLGNGKYNNDRTNNRDKHSLKRPPAAVNLFMVLDITMSLTPYVVSRRWLRLDLKYERMLHQKKAQKPT